VNQTALDAELHQTTVDKLMETLRLLIHNVIWPVTSQVKPELLKSRTGLQSVYDSLGDLKNNLNKDYGIRRKRPSSPSTLTILGTQIATDNKTISDDSLTMKQS